jgi:2'-5' RNA ligase
MRLFVALDLPDTILRTLDALIQELKPAASLIRWSATQNLHITTKFIGDWPEERLPQMKAALAAVQSPGTFKIRIEGLGWFPNPYAPKVFWAGIHGPQALRDLARKTDRATAALGVAPETRPFHPHMTLARIKPLADLAPLQQAIGRLSQVEFGTFEATSQFLYSSQLKPSGSVYTKLEEFPLS